MVWKKQASSGFQVELSTSTSFAPRNTTKIRLDDPAATFATTTLKSGTWYIRVMAAAEGGYTDPSEVVQIKMGVDGGVNGLENPTAVEDVMVTTSPIKMLENGQVYILRNGVRYNILGRTAQ